MTLAPVWRSSSFSTSRRPARDSWLHPVARCPVIAIDLATIIGRPCEFRPAVIVRRVFQHLLVQIDDVAALLRVVLQHRPWQRMKLLAHPKKAAERHHRVDRAIANLV